VVDWRDLDWILGFDFLEEFLEKGNTRKHTEIRVARCKEMFGGILGVLRCFTKRIHLGEFKFNDFLGFGR
jgi:hypothetical protein